MTKGDEWLHEMDLFGSNSPFTRAVARDIWSNVYTLMVQHASGQEVRAVTGIINPASIYRAEQVELLMNKNILGLDGISLKPRYSFQ